MQILWHTLSIVVLSSGSVYALLLRVAFRKRIVWELQYALSCCLWYQLLQYSVYQCFSYGTPYLKTKTTVPRCHNRLPVCWGNSSSVSTLKYFVRMDMLISMRFACRALYYLCYITKCATEKCISRRQHYRKSSLQGVLLVPSFRYCYMIVVTARQHVAVWRYLND